MHVAVVGSGKMGSAIFRVLSSSSIKAATLYSRNVVTAKEQERKLHKTLERARRRGAIDEDEYRTKKESFASTDRLLDLAPADLVIETVSEDYQLKANLLAELESIVGRDAILTTNTSSISVERLASELRHPHRFCGLHFFHPVLMILIVEIIKSSGTSAEALDRVTAFCKAIERNPIVVGDGPGSAINGILAFYYVEGLYLLDEGRALPSVVDELARRYFYLGPCESMDVVGIDFFVRALEIFLGVESLLGAGGSGRERPSLPGVGRGFHPPHLLSVLLSSGRVGKRVAKGIYRYDKDMPVDELPEFYAAPDHHPEEPSASKDFIAQRLLYSVFNGSLDVLERSASSPEALDLGIKEVLLMKEGPFTMMQSLGEAEVRKNFAMLAEQVGERFARTEFPIFRGGG